LEKNGYFLLNLIVFIDEVGYRKDRILLFYSDETDPLLKAPAIFNWIFI
jgi:hypothetical protein